MRLLLGHQVRQVHPLLRLVVTQWLWLCLLLLLLQEKDRPRRVVMLELMLLLVRSVMAAKLVLIRDEVRLRRVSVIGILKLLPLHLLRLALVNHLRHLKLLVVVCILTGLGGVCGHGWHTTLLELPARRVFTIEVLGQGDELAFWSY